MLSWLSISMLLWTEEAFSTITPSQLISLDPIRKCRGIVLRSAYGDLLALLKLNRKDIGEVVSHGFSPKHPEHNDHFDYTRFLTRNPLIHWQLHLQFQIPH